MPHLYNLNFLGNKLISTHKFILVKTTAIINIHHSASSFQSKSEYLLPVLPENGRLDFVLAFRYEHVSCTAPLCHMLLRSLILPSITSIISYLFYTISDCPWQYLHLETRHGTTYPFMHNITKGKFTIYCPC